MAVIVSFSETLPYFASATDAVLWTDREQIEMLIMLYKSYDFH